MARREREREGIRHEGGCRWGPAVGFAFNLQHTRAADSTFPHEACHGRRETVFHHRLTGGIWQVVQKESREEREKTRVGRRELECGFTSGWSSIVVVLPVAMVVPSSVVIGVLRCSESSAWKHVWLGAQTPDNKARAWTQW